MTPKSTEYIAGGVLWAGRLGIALVLSLLTPRTQFTRSVAFKCYSSCICSTESSNCLLTLGSSISPQRHRRYTPGDRSRSRTPSPPEDSRRSSRQGARLHDFSPRRGGDHGRRHLASTQRRSISEDHGRHIRFVEESGDTRFGDRDHERSPSPHTRSGHPSWASPVHPRQRYEDRHDEGRRISVHGSLSHSDSVSTGRRTARLLTGLPLNFESEQRRKRRDRESHKEDSAENRLRTGKKPHHVNVNSEGKPYGLGVQVWNDALAKMVRGLDPSYTDIRQQPFHNIEILMKRLDDDFDYSEPLNPSYLRTRIGNALSSYRHEIIRMIQAEQDRPPWVSDEVWEKLTRLANSEKFKAKSEQMKYANTCRRTKGRTGPLGASGITERLRLQLQRSPTSDEIFAEMSRDKGYGGRSRRNSKSNSSKSITDEDGQSLSGVPQDPSTGTMDCSDGNNEDDLAGADLPHLSSAPDPCTLQSTYEMLSPARVTSKVPRNPLSLILERQIEELLECGMEQTSDGLSLITTLHNQLNAMRDRSSASVSEQIAPVAPEAVNFQCPQSNSISTPSMEAAREEVCPMHMLISFLHEI